jgi:hypothetical protein
MVLWLTQGNGDGLKGTGFSPYLEFLHFSGPKAAPDTKSCSIIPSGCRIWREKTLALYQGMAFSHAAHGGEELGL